MSQIDRRRLLTTLVAGATSASLPSSIASAANAAKKVAVRNIGPTCGAWLIERQPNRDLAPHHVVDFWSMPWTEVGYREHLPPQIARGTIWHETIDAQAGSREALDCIRSYQESARTDGQFSFHFDGIETLSSTLASLIGESKSERRVAIVALDSEGPEKDWAHILPALSGCYDAIIGICHLERRGLRQQKAWLAPEFFEQHFLKPAYLCDAVIITSPALVEANVRIFPDASTEELAGRLARDLGCALLTPAVLDQVAGAGRDGAMRRPRFFALCGLALETDYDCRNYYHIIMDRQAALVAGSFGENDHCLTVLTAGEKPDGYCAMKLRDDTEFFTAAVPAARFENRRCGGLSPVRMITLWPFQLDEELDTIPPGITTCERSKISKT